MPASRPAQEAEPVGEAARAAAAPDARLADAAGLVSEAALAFLEGNPWRARKVRQECHRILAEEQAHEERLLGLVAEGSGGAVLLGSPVEGLARAAQQLAGLAESRPPTAAHAALAAPLRAVVDAAVPLLAALQAGGTGLDAAAALDGVRAAKEALVKACMAHAGAAPRSFSQAMLAAAAGTRLEEAAEHAARALRVLDRTAGLAMSPSPQ